MCSERNSELVTELGADDVVDYTKGEKALKEALQKIVRDHGPFDLCFDTVRAPHPPRIEIRLQPPSSLVNMPLLQRTQPR